MPNLTSYHAPAIHLNRELPKNYCDLIEHEMNYIHFLRSRLMNIQSNLTYTNPKSYLFHIQQVHSVNDSKIYRKMPVDYQKEKRKYQIDISHFRLRQKQWKNKIDYENQRFIRTLLDRRVKYRPLHDRYATQKSFKRHLKLLENMSEYSRFNRINSKCKKFFHNHRLNLLKINSYSRQTISYIENIIQQNINQAIHIYNQPLPFPSKTMYLESSQRRKPSLYHRQKLF